MNLSELLSKPQQYAVVSILIKIMEADGVIDPNEVQFINGILRNFQISEREMETIDTYDILHSISLLHELDSDTSAAIKELFIDMAKCDGYADPRELDIIQRLCI